MAGLAQVTGEPYVSDEPIWTNGVYRYRIAIKFAHVMLPEHRPLVLGQIRDSLTSAFGTNYGWGLRNQALLTEGHAETIVQAILANPNDLPTIQGDIDSYIAQASVPPSEQEQVEETVPPVSPTPPVDEGAVPKAGNGKQPDTASEDTAHAAVQHALIRLGDTTGSSVWIATNDKNRLHKGEPLGAYCLKALPNLGLSKEAMARIALIDIIWVRQNAPVCAFEVETTT